MTRSFDQHEPSRLAPSSARCADAPAGRERLAYAPPLDGLRAVAILAVLGFHAGLGVLHGGFLGVDVFFVLSGYLITTLLAAEQEASGRVALARFYMRRALRLFPALVMVVAAIAAWSSHAILPGQIEEIRREIVTTLLYVANWAQAAQIVHPLGFLSHTWSLAIEEQFYIVWPLVLGALAGSGTGRSKWKLACSVAAVGAALSALLRAALWHGPESVPRVFHGSDTRAEALLVGCVIALALRIVPSWSDAARSFARIASAAGLVVLAWMFATAAPEAAWMYHGGFTLVALAAAAVLLELRVSPDGALARALSFGPAVAIGRISYGLYLWHWPLFLVLSPQFTGLSAAATLAVRLAATFAVATVSWFAVERPLLAWKSRWK